MVGVLGLARWAALRYEELLARHGIWMVWNTVLALVPLCLGLMLLTARRRRTLLWWFGVALGVAFLFEAKDDTGRDHLMFGMRGNDSVKPKRRIFEQLAVGFDVIAQLYAEVV